MTMPTTQLKPPALNKQVRSMHYGCVEIDTKFIIRRALDRTFSLIFSESALSGKNFLQLLQQRTSTQDYQRVGRVLLGLMQNKISESDVKKSKYLDCIHIELQNGNGSSVSRYIKIELKKPIPQYQDDSWVVIVHDISKSVRESIKQRQAEKHQTQPNSQQQDLLALIENDRYEVESFLKNTTSSLQDLVKHLSKTKPTIDNANDILCLIKQIKIEARQLRLVNIVRTLKHFEATFGNTSINNENYKRYFKQLPVMLKRFIRTVNHTKKLHQKLVAGHWYNEKEPTSDFLTTNLENHIKNYSEQCNKRVLFVNDGYSSQGLPSNFHDIIDKITHQLVSLLISKSIEESKTRVSYSKTPYGCIHVSISINDDSLNVVVRDDGRGLNAVKIKEKAVSSGLFHSEKVKQWTKQTILNAIFAPNFAGPNHLNYFVEGGIKLEKIHQHMENIGGTIIVRSIMGQFTEFCLSFPLSKK